MGRSEASRPVDDQLRWRRALFFSLFLFSHSTASIGTSPAWAVDAGGLSSHKNMPASVFGTTQYMVHPSRCLRRLHLLFTWFISPETMH